MKYIQKERYVELRKKYDVIIGWGAGVEFQRYYSHNILAYDHMIDGAGRNIGKMKNGITVQGIEVVRKYSEKDSVLVIIYPNIENVILRQVKEILPKADTIVARLVYADGVETSYSVNWEDIIMLDYIQTRYMDFTYMDIGVCHPVIRNNTYLFYEKGFFNGVLVEPNKEMCDLAMEYRPYNKIINVGASPISTTGQLTYYYDPVHPGLNTFQKDIAYSRGMLQNLKKIPMKDINTIIAENFETYPNVLDIDTEGLDYELLEHIDLRKYPIDLICAETSAGDRIQRMMINKGYKILERTEENEIYVRR